MKSLLYVALGLTLVGTAANAAFNAGDGSLVGVGTLAGPRAPVSITQNFDTTTIEAVQVACGVAGVYTTQNWYLRRFFLGDHMVPGNLTVSTVFHGVEQLDMADGSAPPAYSVGVNVYTIDPADAFTFANLVLAGSSLSPISAADEGSIKAVPVTAYVPCGQDMVVAIDAPDGSLIGAGLQFRPGANSAGALYDAYIAAADCGLTEPLAVSDIGFFDSQTIFVVDGDNDEDCGGVPTEETTWGAIKNLYN